MKPNCIDISTWQQNVDFNKVKAAGVTAVIIRGGFSETKDNQFENHYRGARAAGLKIGAYWYSYAYSVSEAEKEAKACISVLSGKSFDLPVYYDMEESGQMALGMTALTNIACRFLDTLKAKGYRVGVYSSPSWFSQFLNYDLLTSKYSIWLAQWGSSSYAYDCDIWQYADDGSVPGIDGNVDMNRVINEDIINGSGGGGQKIYFDISMPYLAKSGYISTGEEVKTVQLLLNAMGYGNLEVDGIFGSATELAVKRFQTSRGLEPDGVVGPDTWRYLLK